MNSGSLPGPLVLRPRAFTSAPGHGKNPSGRLRQRQVFEWLARHKDGGLPMGRSRPEKVTINAAQHDSRHDSRHIATAKRSEEQIQLAARVFENTIEGIMVTDVDGVINGSTRRSQP